MKKAQIKDFPNYIITDTGDVYSCNYMHTGKVHKLATHTDKDGYLRCLLYSNGRRKLYGIHRLVAEAFIQNPDNKPVINHKNGIKTDNRVKNLEFCTVSENTKHAFDVLGRKAHNLGQKGKECPWTKIVLQIQDGKIIAEFYGTREAERETGISSRQISSCCRNRKHYNTAGGYQWKYKE